MGKLIAKMKRKAELAGAFNGTPTEERTKIRKTLDGSNDALALTKEEAKRKRRRPKEEGELDDFIPLDDRPKKKKGKKSKSTVEPEEGNNGATEHGQAHQPGAEGMPSGNGQKKKGKKSKLTAKPGEEAVAEENGQADQPSAEGMPSASEQKKKKEKKSSKKQTKETEQASSKPDTADKHDPGEEESADGSEKKHRFIVFVGNLPYSATKESVEKHFTALQPSSIRLLTHLTDPSKTRGIAFIEFDHHGRMEACLERYHHSEFDDGVSPKRKINVELT